MALAHFVLERPVGGGNHAHVDSKILGAADALEGLLLEESEQLGLKCRNHLADLVQKHRAAIRRFDQPALLSIGAREGAAFVPEQLALEQCLRAAPNT